MNDRERAKEVIRAILHAAGGRLESKIRLYKAFYKAHLNYWERTGSVLSRYPIVRMPRGPGIDDGEGLLSEMKGQGLIDWSIGTPGRPLEQVFTLTSSIGIDQGSQEFECIQEATLWAVQLRPDHLSELTHQTSRSWREGVDGQELDIYADHLPEDRVNRTRAATADVAAIISRSLSE